MVRKYRKAKDKPARDGIGVSSAYMQLRSRRIDYVRSRKNPSSVVDNGISSSSARNDCRNVVVGGFIDLEEDREDGDSKTQTFRRETKRKLFENLIEKSMENPSQIGSDFESKTIKESSDCCFSGRRSSSEEKVKSTTEKQPTESEIEEFFVVAEKKLQENFKNKYNFDFEKEKPLEGRYEWIKSSE